MTTTMMRVRSDIHALLQRMAEEEGASMQTILDSALQEYRRARIFEQADRAFAALRADPKAWQEELEERAVWDRALGDDLSDSPYELGDSE